MLMPMTASLLLRPATTADAAVLADLAALDGARPLTGDVLLAEVDGRPAAALELATGRTVADPFVRAERLRAVLLVQARPQRVGSARVLRLTPVRAR